MQTTMIVAGIVLALGTAIRVEAQSPAVSSQELLKNGRVLTRAEVDGVLQSVRTAMTAKTFRVAGVRSEPGPKMQILMDSQGRPRYLLTDNGGLGVSLEDFTGMQALSCDGKLLGDELVIEYDLDDSGTKWTAHGLTRGRWHTMPKYYEMFDATPESGQLRHFGNRLARGLVAPMKDVVDSGISSAPGTKREVKQALWIDVETLLPLRWEMVVDGIATPYGLSFAHDPSLQIAPPKDVRAPSCVRDQ